MVSVATQLGGISPEAAAVVAAANAASAAAARTPASSSEALDSSSVIEVSAPPEPTKTAPLPGAPGSSSKTVAADAAAKAEHATPAKVTPPAAAPAANELARPRRSDPPIPIAAADPFRDAPVAKPSDPDLSFVKKRSSKSVALVALGAVALVGIGLYAKLSSSGEEASPSTPKAAQLGPAPESPEDDIPPPPSKDELAATPVATAVSPAEESPEPSPKPEPPAAHAKTEPSPKAAAPAAHAKTERPPKTETPKTVAAATPPKPKPAKAAPAPASPKTAPKSTGGGIVRDSPF